MDIPVSSFSRFLRSSNDENSIYLPSVHIVAKVTAGLGLLYKQIKDENILTQTQTDANGKFIPKRNIFIAGRYVIQGCISNKGQSAVLIKAQDSYWKYQKVIVKVVHRTYLAAGLKELFTLRRINSLDCSQASHTIRLLNSFFHNGHICLVFPCYDSRPVTNVLAETCLADQKLSSALRKISRHLLTALAFLRTQKIIHADLKPDNILLDETGDLDTITLIDFGNSLHCSESLMYYDDFEIQTLSYRAPEVHLGIPFGLEIDMWSLGCILFECYTGQTLFSGVGRQDIFQKIISLLGSPPAHMSGKFSLNLKPSCDQHKSATLGLMSVLTDTTNYEFASFLSGLLAISPEDRMTPWEALQHPFMLTDICIPFFLGELPPYSSATVQHKDYLFRPAASETVSLLSLKMGITDPITNQDKNSAKKVNVKNDTAQSPVRLFCRKTLNDHTPSNCVYRTPTKHGGCRLAPQQNLSKSMLNNLPSSFEKTDLGSEEKCKWWLQNMAISSSSFQHSRKRLKLDMACTTNDGIVPVDHLKQQELKRREDLQNLNGKVSPSVTKKERFERSFHILSSQNPQAGDFSVSEIQPPLKISAMTCQKYKDKNCSPLDESSVTSKEKSQRYLSDPHIIHKKEHQDLEESKKKVSPVTVNESRNQVQSPGVSRDISQTNCHSFIKKPRRKQISDVALSVNTSSLLPKKLKTSHHCPEKMYAGKNEHSTQSPPSTGSNSRDLNMTFTLEQIKADLNNTLLKDTGKETLDFPLGQKLPMLIRDSLPNSNILQSGNRRETESDCKVSPMSQISYNECKNGAFSKVNENETLDCYGNSREIHHQKLKGAERMQNVTFTLQGRIKNIKTKGAKNSVNKFSIDSSYKLNHSDSPDTMYHSCASDNISCRAMKPQPLISHCSETTEMSSNSESCSILSDPTESSHTGGIEEPCSSEENESDVDCPLHQAVKNSPILSGLSESSNHRLLQSQSAVVNKNLESSFSFCISNIRKKSPLAGHFIVPDLEHMDCSNRVNVNEKLGQDESLKHLIFQCIADHENQNNSHASLNCIHTVKRDNLTSPIGLRTKRLDCVQTDNRDSLTSPSGLKDIQRSQVLFSNSVQQSSELNTTYSLSRTRFYDNISSVAGDDCNTNKNVHRHLQHRKAKCHRSSHLLNSKKKSYSCSKLNSTKGNKMDNGCAFRSPDIYRPLVKTADLKLLNGQMSERHLNIVSQECTRQTSHSRFAASPKTDVTYSSVNSSKGCEDIFQSRKVDKRYNNYSESDGTSEQLSSFAEEDVLLLP